jgi:hypothetical protein
MQNEYQSTSSFNALRATYMNIFSQIFDKSIKISCICKSVHKKSMLNVERSNFPIKTEELTYNNENLNDQSRNLMNDNNKSFDKICDLSCFENLKFASFSLKNSIGNINPNDSITDEQNEKFEKAWSSFKFLVEDPSSCDYNGTTIFHNAAADNSFHLLRLMIKKYINGVFSVDSKGMTPLMRAVQRNSKECIELLITETESDINGSSFSVYTPLWFSVSNGYNELVILLLNYGANPSIIEKNKTASNYQQINALINDEDHVGIQGHQEYLFSPLKASIVYSRYEIMIFLLKYGANVYELFYYSKSDYEDFNLRDNLKPNEYYVNSLKFLFREFGKHGLASPLEKNSKNNANYLKLLNDFIENQNVYRKMLIEFVKTICNKIKSNPRLLKIFDNYLNDSKNFHTDLLYTITIEIQNNKANLDWHNFILHATSFMKCVDSFLLLQFEVNNENNERKLSLDDFKILDYKRANYHTELFEFSKMLHFQCFAPKSLKELCRFKIRTFLFKQINSSKIKYKKYFTKSDHQIFILNKLNTPNYLIDYILHNI